ncbi:MFS transporter [Haliscomenobacter sp.]|uniref:MFS transporter n=1 Tax=Haliscomenobacter sp. TaxID=2717303 RepID=UPI003593DA08
MKKPEFITFSACAMVLTALGIDIMLPALGHVRDHFKLGAESTAASLIITYFFMGQIGQLLFGLLSDRLGRLAILKIGFPLYILGGLLAAFSPGLQWMLIGRFFSGVGAAAIFTTTIAGVRDRYEGDQMAGTMSLIFTIFLFTPIFAPFLGTFVLAFFDWRTLFFIPPAFAVLVFLWSFRLDESLPKALRANFEGRELIRQMRTVLGNRTFLRYSSIATLLFIPFSAYIASSERIVGEIYQQPTLFKWIFGGMGLVMALCTSLNARLVARFGAFRSMRGLLVLYVIVGAALFTSTWYLGNPPPMVLFFVGITLLMGINVAIEPNSSALALAPLGDAAGTAASLYGTFFFFIGSGLGALISKQLVDGVSPLILAYFLMGVVAMGLIVFTRRT